MCVPTLRIPRTCSNLRDEIARNAQIVQLLATHHRSLLSYVFSLVPNRADAEDIVHDTIVVILEKFGEFQHGTDFLAWGAGNRVQPRRQFHSEEAGDRRRRV